MYFLHLTRQPAVTSHIGIQNGGELAAVALIPWVRPYPAPRRGGERGNIMARLGWGREQCGSKDPDKKESLRSTPMPSRWSLPEMRMCSRWNGEVRHLGGWFEEFACTTARMAGLDVGGYRNPRIFGEHARHRDSPVPSRTGRLWTGA